MCGSNWKMSNIDCILFFFTGKSFREIKERYDVVCGYSFPSNWFNGFQRHKNLGSLIGRPLIEDLRDGSDSTHLRRPHESYPAR